MVFPKTMPELGHKLADDAVVCVKGRVDKREDQPKLVAMEVDRFEAGGRLAAAAHQGVAPALNDALVERTSPCSCGSPGTPRCTCTWASSGSCGSPTRWSGDRRAGRGAARAARGRPIVSVDRARRRDVDSGLADAAPELRPAGSLD